MDGTEPDLVPVGLGTHLIIDLYGGSGLDDPPRIEAALRRAVDAAGATLLGLHLHRFAPQGVTGVAILAESHITVHTWPERGFAAFDAFMCGDANPTAVVQVLAEAFETDKVQTRTLTRGT
jgi:S-adenosylmethionine decarboxylase